MPSLPESWKLEPKKRADGRLDLVGKDVRGEDYVARTTEGPGVTESDLQLLSVGNRETSSAAEVVKFYQKEREDFNRRQADSMTDEYLDGAEKVVRAGLHLSESRVGYSRCYAEAWERESMATKVISVTPKAVSGQMATFAVATDLVAPYKYHWKKDGAFIAGAPSAKTYTTPPLQQQDLRSLFSVVVYGQDASEESDGVALNKDIPDAVTVPNQGPPKPAWQPFVEPKGTN